MNVAQLKTAATQNSGICSPGGNDGEMYYGQLQEILECQRMLHGATAVTVAVMIVPLHTIYLPVAGVASLTEAKAPVKPIWVEGKRADYIPARRP
ncbi:hypothetical protein Tco_0533668, partial [Tanacetum coccineum]